MKRKKCPSCKAVVVSVTLLLLIGLITLILTQTSSAGIRTKTCNEIMAEALDEIAELKSSRSSLECLKSNLAESKSGQLESIDNSGAKEYLQRFHQTLGYNDTMKADPNNLSTVALWWEAAAILAWYMNPPQNAKKRHPCQNMIPFGNWPVCQDEHFVVKKPCLIYSFGIANDFSFDDYLGRIGCEVHSFDPSMNTPDHVRSENVTFHNLGLAPYDTNAWEPSKDSYVQDKQIWKVRTLKSVMSELNHTNKVIDILKMDIETTEWTVLSNIIQTDLLKNIRIFLIEYHLFPTRPFKEDYITFLKTVTHLRERGFREFFYEPCCLRTINPNDFNYQAHVGYVNFNF